MSLDAFSFDSLAPKQNSHFFRQHLQLQFHEWKHLNFTENFTATVYKGLTG